MACMIQTSIPPGYQVVSPLQEEDRSERPRRLGHLLCSFADDQHRLLSRRRRYLYVFALISHTVGKQCVKQFHHTAGRKNTLMSGKFMHDEK